MFGMILTLSGVLHGVVIGLVLRPNPVASTYQLILGFVLAAGTCTLGAVGLLLLFLVDNHVFYTVDPLMKTVQFGTLDPTTNFLVDPPHGSGSLDGVNSRASIILFGVCTCARRSKSS
jgi:hypothetical protein